MATQNYRDMMWLVRPHVPGCPDIQLFYYFAEAVREHLARSLAWQYDIGANVGGLDLGASTAWPTITAGTHIPTNTYVVQPTRLKWSDGSDITFLTRDQLDKRDSDWEQDASGAKPWNWTTLEPGNWRVYPLLASASTGDLYMRVAVAPKIHKATSLTAIEENLAYQYRDAWARGALAKLMAIPGKDWTDFRLANDYQLAFKDDIKTAKSKVAADYGRPDRAVTYGGLSIGGSGRANTDDYGN